MTNRAKLILGWALVMPAILLVVVVVVGFLCEFTMQIGWLGVAAIGAMLLIATITTLGAHLISSSQGKK